MVWPLVIAAAAQVATDYATQDGGGGGAPGAGAAGIGGPGGSPTFASIEDRDTRGSVNTGALALGDHALSGVGDIAFGPTFFAPVAIGSGARSDQEAQHVATDTRTATAVRPQDDPTALQPGGGLVPYLNPSGTLISAPVPSSGPFTPFGGVSPLLIGGIVAAGALAWYVSR